MNAKELETRTAAAEKDPSLVRALITDFKAHKDGQLSDLTGQVNAGASECKAAQDALDKYKDSTLKRTAEIFAVLANHDLDPAAAVAEILKDDRQKAIDAAQAELDAARKKLDDLSK